MSKGEHRRFTAEQKLEILREAAQAGVTVSQVCRRNALVASVFYRWRAVADQAIDYLAGNAKRAHPKRDRERGRLQLGLSPAF